MFLLTTSPYTLLTIQIIPAPFSMAAGTQGHYPASLPHRHQPQQRTPFLGNNSVQEVGDLGWSTPWLEEI